MKHFSSLISNFSFQNGFTLIELMVVMGIFSILVGLTTINLVNIQHKSTLSATVLTFTADLKSQQLRAMVGDGGGTSSASDYGVRFETTGYTQFRTSFGNSNFTVALPDNVNVLTTFPGSEIIFLKGSGDVSGFTSSANTVTFRDTADGSQKIIIINRYGVVTSVN